MPDPDDENATVSISTVFYPGADDRVTDTVLRSSDGVLFYVSSAVLLNASNNALRSHLGASLEEQQFRDTVLDVPDTSPVLNIIIHAFYGLPCDKDSPTLDELEVAVNQFESYGLNPHETLVPDAPLYQLLLVHTPVSPLRVYILAAHHNIEPLAVATSAYLLSTPLSSVTEDMSARMGATYLGRLARLQWGRLEQLKETILQPPPHIPRQALVALPTRRRSVGHGPLHRLTWRGILILVTPFCALLDSLTLTDYAGLQ